MSEIRLLQALESGSLTMKDFKTAQIKEINFEGKNKTHLVLEINGEEYLWSLIMNFDMKEK